MRLCVPLRGHRRLRLSREDRAADAHSYPMRDVQAVGGFLYEGPGEVYNFSMFTPCALQLQAMWHFSLQSHDYTEWRHEALCGGGGLSRRGYGQTPWGLCGSARSSRELLDA